MAPYLIIDLTYTFKERVSLTVVRAGAVAVTDVGRVHSFDCIFAANKMRAVFWKIMIYH
jgi:hypothetical protein